MWTTNDGYHEALVSLHTMSAPIFKLRCVLLSDGKYKSIVRSHEDGLMIAASNKLNTLMNARTECFNILKKYLERETIQFTEYIEKYKEAMRHAKKMTNVNVQRKK